VWTLLWALFATARALFRTLREPWLTDA
jgi:hypothetical protein